MVSGPQCLWKLSGNRRQVVSFSVGNGENMKILLIANTVDHGTRSIADAYTRCLRPTRRIDIPAGLKQMGIRTWLRFGIQIRRAAKEADVVVCLHHGALCLGALFLPKTGSPRRVAITDWTRAFPSRRRDLYIRVYNRVYALLCKAYDQVFSPAPGLRKCYEGLVDMHPTIYPLPYPEIMPPNWQKREASEPWILYVGANIQRKGGDVLLEKWRQARPAKARLSFVSPHAPDRNEDLPMVQFFRDVSANTPEHRKLFESHSIFLLPTRHDAYGFAVLEALNFGLVVVTTEAAGIAELVRESGGMVGQSPEEAVRFAFDLASRPDDIRRRRERCRNFIQDYPHLLEKHIRNLLNPQWS